MTVNGVGFTFVDLKKFLRFIGVIFGTLSIVVPFMGAFTWFVIEPRVRPSLDAIKDIPEINKRLHTIEKRLGVEPAIVFSPTVFASPSTARAGTKVRAIYRMRHATECPVDVMRRWFSHDRLAYDPKLNELTLATLPSVTMDPVDFAVLVDLPSDLTPGVWSYRPLFTPQGECAGQRAIEAPALVVTVLK